MLYSFTLKYKVEASLPASHYIQLLAEFCGDAIIGTGVVGVLAIQYDRVADSLEDALISAFQEVKTAIPRAKLIHVETQ